MFNPEKPFHLLNYDKVVAALKLTFAIFTGIFLVLLSIYNFADAPISITISFIVLLTYAAVSDFIFFFAFKKWKKNLRKRISLFNSEVFNLFKKHQIDNSIIFKENKWKFNEETITFRIRPFEVISNPNSEINNAVDFNFQASIKLTPENTDSVNSFCDKHELDLYNKNRIKGITKTITLNNKTQFELYNEVLKTATLLQENEFRSNKDYW